MANNVFANGRELSCKAGSGKSICAFPDVCFTPPECPATPPGVPVPYPNTGMTSDTTSGSKTVKVSGKEVMLKNKSYFKKSMGDEAGCATKKGILTSVNRGKVYFNAWSMDVKIEGQNAVRHLDLTTHNHNPSVGQTPPWAFVDTAATGKASCKAEKEQEKEACKEYKPHKEDGRDVCKDAGLLGPVVQKNADAGQFKTAAAWADEMSIRAAGHECISARRCQLVPYDGEKDGINGCCPSQTPDHLIPKASFYKSGYNGGKGARLDGWNGDPGYQMEKAPCICAEGGSNTAGSHGLRHAHHKATGPTKDTMQSFDNQASLAAEGAAEVFSMSGCSKECIEAQLKKGHEKMGKGKVKHSPSGSVMEEGEIEARAAEYEPETTARG